MKIKWNFLGGGRQNKKPSMGEYGYFLELHNINLMLSLFAVSTATFVWPASELSVVDLMGLMSRTIERTLFMWEKG